MILKFLNLSICNHRGKDANKSVLDEFFSDSFPYQGKKKKNSDSYIHFSVMDTVLQNISCCLPGRD